MTYCVKLYVAEGGQGMITLSVMSSLTIPPRPAPIETRIAISAERLCARASRSPATFEQAIANFGAPEEVLTDNGAQYHTWRGKSAFTKLLERRGVRVADITTVGIKWGTRIMP